MASAIVRLERYEFLTHNDCLALEEWLDWLREGDTLVVTRLDRLARSVGAVAEFETDIRTEHQC